MEREAGRSRRHYALILLSALLVGAGLHIFIYPADFAPAGVDGVATVLQYLSRSLFGFRINAGVFTLLLNFPLLLAAGLVLRRRYVLYTLAYTLSLSLFLVLYEAVGLYQYEGAATGAGPLIAAVFGGACQGLTGIPLRLGGSSGGVDIVGSLLAVRAPHRNVERLISYVSYAVVLLSFFVWGDLGSVCLSVISIFVCERVTAAILRPARGALRFEIVASPASAARITAFLTERLSHGATLLSAEGAYTGEERRVIVCLVTRRDLGELLTFLRGEKEAFLSYSEAEGVVGSFERK